MFVHGNLQYCGERSIFLVSICNFPKCSIARTHKSFEAAVRSAYSSNLVGFKQYVRIGRLGLLMNLMTVIVVFRFLMSASVDTPALHIVFSVWQTENTPSANFILQMCVGSSFFSTALDVEP
jgi:hypothetical protein